MNHREIITEAYLSGTYIREFVEGILHDRYVITLTEEEGNSCRGNDDPYKAIVSMIKTAQREAFITGYEAHRQDTRNAIRTLTGER